MSRRLNFWVVLYAERTLSRSSVYVTRLFPPRVRVPDVSLRRLAAHLVFHRQGGHKIALPTDHLLYAERLLTSFEVKSRHVQIDPIHRIGFRRIGNENALTLCAENVHGNRFEKEYSLLPFHGTRDAVDREVVSSQLLAAHVPCE